jgi:hypothetical protein
MPIPELKQDQDGKWQVRNDFNHWRRAYYNTFFGTDESRAVFYDLLRELGYFGTIDTEERRHLNNFAKRLLSWVGELEMVVNPPVTVVLERFGLPARPGSNPQEHKDVLSAMITGREQKIKV